MQSKAYVKFEEESLLQLKYMNKAVETIRHPVNVKCRFYMKTKRKVDLTNLLEAVDDILVKGGIVEDDNRDIIAMHDGSIVLYDKEKPRVEITIEELIGYDQWKVRNK